MTDRLSEYYAAYLIATEYVPSEHHQELGMRMALAFGAPEAWLERKIAAAVLAEREACAQLADEYIYDALGGSIIRDRSTQES